MRDATIAAIRRLIADPAATDGERAAAIARLTAAGIPVEAPMPEGGWPWWTSSWTITHSSPPSMHVEVRVYGTWVEPRD